MTPDKITVAEYERFLVKETTFLFSKSLFSMSICFYDTFANCVILADIYCLCCNRVRARITDPTAGGGRIVTGWEKRHVTW